MKKNTNFLIKLYIGLVAIAAVVLMFWITPYGSGVSPDSIVYIGAARNLLSGNGFSISGRPITHFPPMFSLLLATTNIFGNDPVQASRFLNAILFGINLYLVAFAVYITADRKFLTTNLAILFFLASAPLIQIHAWAWSEPLFITLSLVGVILLSMYVARPTLELLTASSFTFGLATVTRYTGVAFIPPALVIVFLGGSQQLGRRIRDTIIWLVLASIPLGILFVRNYAITGSATDRDFAFHQMAVTRYVTQVSSGLSDFVAPTALPAGVRPTILGSIIILFIVLAVIFFERHLRDTSWHSLAIAMPLSSLLLTISYLLFLYVSISFFDAATPVDRRLLSPIFVILTVGGFAAISTVSRGLNKPLVRWSFLFLVALSILIKIPGAIQSATTIQSNGLGYTSRQWQGSETIAFVKSLPRDLRIYSNLDVLGFATEGYSVYFLPAKMDKHTLEVNYSYTEVLQAMCKDIRENKALLVYFNQIQPQHNLPSQEELESICPLSVLRYLADGTVYAEKH